MLLAVLFTDTPGHGVRHTEQLQAHIDWVDAPGVPHWRRTRTSCRWPPNAMGKRPERRC